MKSKAQKLRTKLAQILQTDESKVDIFSVMLKQRRPPITDVRFSAHGSPYYKPVKLNGLVLLNREEVSVLLAAPAVVVPEVTELFIMAAKVILCKCTGGNKYVFDLIGTYRLKGMWVLTSQWWELTSVCTRTKPARDPVPTRWTSA